MAGDGGQKPGRALPHLEFSEGGNPPIQGCNRCSGPAPSLSPWSQVCSLPRLLLLDWAFPWAVGPGPCWEGLGTGTAGVCVQGRGAGFEPVFWSVQGVGAAPPNAGEAMRRGSQAAGKAQAWQLPSCCPSLPGQQVA